MDVEVAGEGASDGAAGDDAIDDAMAGSGETAMDVVEVAPSQHMSVGEEPPPPKFRDRKRPR